jgi:GntR family transcriptional repressor for pyruvate dehydrogenase complex
LPTEQELCGSLSVGRSTVREALRVLQAVGLVELRAGRGAFVASTNGSDQESISAWFAQNRPELRDVMELREAIEPVSVRLAVERRGSSDLKRLRAIHERFQLAADEMNVSELALLDEEFHTAIVEAADNALLTRINRLIANELRAYRVRALATRDRVTHALQPHEEILSAIERQDAGAAVESMTHHLEISIADILREAERADESS